MLNSTCGHWNVYINKKNTNIASLFPTIVTKFARSIWNSSNCHLDKVVAVALSLLIGPILPTLLVEQREGQSLQFEGERDRDLHDIVDQGLGQIQQKVLEGLFINVLRD